MTPFPKSYWIEIQETIRWKAQLLRHWFTFLSFTVITATAFAGNLLSLRKTANSDNFFLFQLAFTISLFLSISFYLSLSIYIYIYIYMCVCVCVRVWSKWVEKGINQTLTAGLVVVFRSLLTVSLLIKKEIIFPLIFIILSHLPESTISPSHSLSLSLYIYIYIWRNI